MENLEKRCIFKRIYRKSLPLFVKDWAKLYAAKLTHLLPMLPFYTVWKHQKVLSVLLFSGGKK